MSKPTDAGIDAIKLLAQAQRIFPDMQLCKLLSSASSLTFGQGDIRNMSDEDISVALKQFLKTNRTTSV